MLKFIPYDSDHSPAHKRAAHRQDAVARVVLGERWAALYGVDGDGFALVPSADAHAFLEELGYDTAQSRPTAVVGSDLRGLEINGRRPFAKLHLVFDIDEARGRAARAAAYIADKHARMGMQCDPSSYVPPIDGAMEVQ